MTAPTPDYLRALAIAPNRLGDGWRISAVAALHQSADALAAVTAERDRFSSLAQRADSQAEQLTGMASRFKDERDQARQMLADVWDEGVVFGWHSTALRTDENPYRKAGL